MEENITNKLNQAGVNIDAALERFLGNEPLLLQFLGKFSEDPSYQSFREAMAEERYGDAFKAVHNLKGLCGNLSLTSLYEIVSVEVEFLRGGENEKAAEFAPELTAEYEKIVAILDTL